MHDHCGVPEDGYIEEASAFLGLKVVAAGLFEPNVPDLVGGIAGLVAWPARRLRLRHVGEVTSTCLVAVTKDEIHIIGVRLRIRGIEPGDQVARWRRDEVEVQRAPVATWTGRPPPWCALRVLAGGRLAAELKPNGLLPSTQAVIEELLHD